MSSPLISIIIPVYNTEKHLPKCLDSAVSQSFKDIEIIVVDDSSPGNCKEICAGYPQVKYTVHEKNRGTFLAHETGARFACGKYLINLDSDDWLPSDICANIVKMGDFDLLLSEVVSVYPSHTEKSRWANKGLKKVSVNFFDFYCNRGYISWAWGGKVFRRDMALQVFDKLAVRDHLILSEDCLFFTAYATLVENVKTLCRPSYYYNLSNESVNRTEVTVQKLEKHFHDLEVVLTELRWFFKNYQQYDLKNIERELFNVFLIRFSNISNGEDIFSLFLPRLTDLYGSEEVGLYISSAKNRGNILLRMKFFKKMLSNRFIRVCLGKLRSIWASY